MSPWPMSRRHEWTPAGDVVYISLWVKMCWTYLVLHQRLSFQVFVSGSAINARELRQKL